MNVLAQLMLFPSLATTVTVTALSPGLGEWAFLSPQSSDPKGPHLQGKDEWGIRPPWEVPGK